jgi:dihydrofolate reductase
MRRIIASVNTTLDGYMEGPNGEGDLGWLMPFVPDGIPDNARLLGEETDAILLGRGTYHGFSRFWPTQEGCPSRRGGPTRTPTSSTATSSSGSAP